ncbi:hypothetical protein L226DRAFT_506158 [Lentinus tigrinus ALCF2SS1-7]|uniref:Transferase-domain-containing protein n=1 Tax=Lentinus tigrinus ALCF2SS1-6 TaxID=1328759 RepID=A0A5C2SLC4_9APHY|nr:hypothetical protein L227DRAFT_328928 [Lentinus tigrinus ALCF2SS1-6]RPD76652.1 hypothetical protein L226DRAFT_506158 [Lentinus tigrinus ALCF2SS1-7]
MTQDERELVQPSGPSVLAGRDSYVLNSNDLLINFTLDIAYVIPSRLNISDLRASLARTLTLFPLFCGRLVRGPEWAISIDPLRPISLTVKHELEPGWDPSTSNAVVRPRPGPLIDKVNPLALLSGDAPDLLKATIAQTDNVTLIGISCSHIVADLFIVLKFLRAWSEHFTNPLGFAAEPEPVYLDATSITLSAPSDPVRLEYIRSKLPPLLFHTFPLDDIPVSIFSPFPIRRIDLRFTSAQVSALHAALLRFQSEAASGGNSEVGKEVQLTRQDALSALVVSALNAAYDIPIKQISNVVNCRGVNPAVLPKDAIGNGLLYAVSDAVSLNEEDPANILVLTYARAIRRSLEEVRHPDYVQDFLALAGAEWLTAAKTNQGHCILETPGHIILNSSYRHDWASAHFGFPGKASWQHPDTVPTDNYVMFFPSNPVRMPDSEWRTDDGACEATFNVKAGRECDLEGAIARGWAAVVGESMTTPTVIIYP